ncbi:hypothetical protein MHB48_15150 [Psychrobacillus sp. FSL H8-0483]|uniref:hypothetical protein n=1 Tax=Psychrobacillus sp. FSL H8-0483 TaxID=2921389 RepID=UPI00315ACFF4
MDFNGIYETLFNFRHTLSGYTLKELKKEFDNYESLEVGYAFHKLVKEEYIEIEKISANDYKIIKVLK